MLISRGGSFVTYIVNLALICSLDTHYSSGLQINVNDILNEKLMPARLFAQPFRKLPKYPDENQKLTWKSTFSNCTDFCAALSTMEFHRQMMNEYLASKFLAKQILKMSEVVERRIGKVETNNEFVHTGNSTPSYNQTEEKSSQRSGKHLSKLLADEGSTNYRDWLERSTLLQDIHRQFELQNISSKVSPTTDGKTKLHRLHRNHRRSSQDNPESIDIVEDEDEEVEDGDITGYAMSNTSPELPQSRLTSPNHFYTPDNAAYMNIQQNDIYTPIVNKNGYDAPYDSYAPPHHTPSQHHHTAPVSSVTIQNKEISLKDITDIAMTTLAFLSFGMFILQVLMCITMGKDDASSMMMLPMEAVENAADIPNDGTEEIRRRKRRSTSEKSQLLLMNDISRRVLQSIDAVLRIPNNNGSCHFYSICEHNRFATKQSNGQKLWIPIWSLGISWLSSRLTADAASDTSNVYEYASISKSLKAALTGFGNGNCKRHYGKECRM